MHRVHKFFNLFSRKTGNTESEFDRHIYDIMDPTPTHQGGESEIHLQHLGDLSQNSEKTRQLLHDYGLTNTLFQEATRVKEEMMTSDVGMDIAEQSKKVREYKAKKEKLKTEILELIMHGDIKRAGFTKADKKKKKDEKADDSQVPTFC